MAGVAGKDFSLYSNFSLLVYGQLRMCRADTSVRGASNGVVGAQSAVQKGKEQKIGHKAGQNCSRRP